MKNPSILTDTAMDLLCEIMEQTGNYHAPQLVEAALRQYLRHLREQDKPTEQTSIAEGQV